MNAEEKALLEFVYSKAEEVAQYMHEHGIMIHAAMRVKINDTFKCGDGDIIYDRKAAEVIEFENYDDDDGVWCVRIAAYRYSPFEKKPVFDEVDYREI